MGRVLLIVAGVAVALVLLLAGLGYEPSWARPTCAEARTTAREELREAVLARAPEYVENSITWRVAEACNPDGAARLLARCDAQDPYRDTQACREVPVDPEGDGGIIGTLWGWVPRP